MTTVYRSPTTVLQFFGNNGLPLVGGSVLTQVGGVNAATYQDAAGSTALPNPIPLNSRGEVSNASGQSCELFLTQGSTYTFTLFDQYGNQIGVYPNINGISDPTYLALTNLQGGAAGELLYQSALNTTGFVGVGTAGYVLSANGGSSPSWVSPSTLTVGNATNAVNATTATSVSGGLTATGAVNLGSNWQIDSNLQLTNNGNQMYLGALYNSAATNSGTVAGLNTLTQQGTNFSVISTGIIGCAAAGLYEIETFLAINAVGAVSGSLTQAFTVSGGTLYAVPQTMNYSSQQIFLSMRGAWRAPAAGQIQVTAGTAYSGSVFIPAQGASFYIRRIG